MTEYFATSFSDSTTISSSPGGVLLHKNKSILPKLILIDRDGVVNEDVGSPGVLDKSQLVLTPGAGLALGRLRRAGCKIALITNQSCVGKGLITEEHLVHGIHHRLQEMLLKEDEDAIFDHIFYCASLKSSNDYRMKPNPGMIEEALHLFGVEEDSTSDDTIFIGDTVSDLEAAAHARISVRILVETGYGCWIMGGKNAPDGRVQVVLTEKEVSHNIKYDKSKAPYIFPFYYVSNLFSATEWILSNAKNSQT
eukprot:CAMPEP_0194209246 /NCGR_PEP_ID=MMETSP0156-20130528/7442_1 /TAXON_ID=33649 /ORGANISM="Thalassionema nitzschioides, Strain L26-B" /LENGTH=251 /DNA_ID=CAMNT_0038936383 /DNA_START=49 /DNA_END=804 /DNA_ORIENTATION=+